MTLDLKHLRELCDAVIPSDKKWITNDDNEVLYHDDDGGEEHIIITDGGYYPPEPEYATFIAATDPPTVRALIDEVERLQQELKIQDEGNEVLINELKSVRKSEQRGVDMTWLDGIIGEKS